MGRRTLPILILFIGILLLAGTAVVFLLSQDQPQETTNVTPIIVTDESGAAVTATPEPGAPPPGTEGESTPLPDTVKVVVSLQTLPRGYQITADVVDTVLVTEDRLASEVGTNVITDTAKLIGKYARTDIFQGQTITKDLFVGDPTLIGVENYGPSVLIPPGFIAQAVPMDRLSGVAYGVSEGDYVDIMITFTFIEIDPQFQSLLENNAQFFIEQVDEEGNITQLVILLEPLGRFEELPTGDLAHIFPSETQRPLAVSMILQNAKVIQVGEWEPVAAVQPATATPEPVGEGTPTPTAGPSQPVTPTPAPPDVLLLALIPQQQLLLKYAVEANANIDFALRGINDGQLYSIENVDLDYLLNRFGIEIPPNFNYTVDVPVITVTPGSGQPAATPTPSGEGDG